MELVRDIRIEEAIKNDFTFVDVRTKEEFENFHIPAALNVPLFTKEEREEISKTYYKKSEKDARFYALQLVGPKLYQIVGEIKRIKGKHQDVAIYCWRGGMRSLSVATICNLVGVRVSRLYGGYRAFRQYILKRMEKICQQLNLVVLYGPTGVGKTRVLKRLKTEGYPVINLEGLAGHRGSVFGGIGLTQPSQKMFESLLWLEVEKLKSFPYILVEGESRKIGRLFIPEPFWKAMESGRKVQLTVPLMERVKISMEDYGVSNFTSQAYLEALERIKRILGYERYRRIKALIVAKNYKEAVKELMLNYYDKLYDKSTPHVDRKIEAETVDDAVRKLKSILNNPIFAR